MRVGILTYHAVRNYGAFLQAYSLCSRLNKEPDINAEIIDFKMACEVKEYKDSLISRRTFLQPLHWIKVKRIHRIQDQLFENARRRLIMSSNSMISDSLDDFVSFVNGKYDVIIAGSDEIWKTNGFRGFPTPYWLIGDITSRKFSYAASGRNDYSRLSESQQQVLKAAISDFEFIGVRDKLTLTEISKYKKDTQTVHLCCDPSFLYDGGADKENGKKILKQFSKKKAKYYIGLMTNDSSISTALNKLVGDDVEVVSLCNLQSCTTNLCEIDPFQWLDVISALDLMISSFYHGVCFSLKIGTPVIAYGTSEKKSKLKEVMETVGKTEDYTEDLLKILNSPNGKKFISKQMSRKAEPFCPDDCMMLGYREMIKQIKSGVNR